MGRTRKAPCPTLKPMGNLRQIGGNLHRSDGIRIAHWLAALDLVQVLETSDIPAGAFNLLTGDPAVLSVTLAEHMALDALWAFAPRGLAESIEAASTSNLKRTWVSAHVRAWDSADMRESLDHATEIKTIWLPYGEG